MFSNMLSLVKVKLCRVAHQGSVRFYMVFAFRMFELVAAIQICIQNWKTFSMIFTRKLNKIKHRKNPHRTPSVDIGSTMNPFFPTSFLPKTLSRFLPPNYDEL